MKGYDLIKGMGYIDDGLVEEALNAEAAGAPAAQKEKIGFGEKLKAFFFGRSAGRWVAAAACLAIAVYAGWGITQSSKDAAPQASEPMYMSDSAKNSESSGYYYAGAAEAEENTIEDAQVEAEEADEPRETEPTEAAPEAVEEPAEAPGEMTVTVASVPAALEPDVELDAVTEMIESYPGDYSSACYVVPGPGEVGYSMPLQDAMAEYDRTVTYRVFVDIFKDGEETPMDGSDKEVAKLLDMLYRDYGITTALEKVKDANGKKHVYPTLHATFDQLRRFPGDEDHGWMLFLYDEKAE